MRDPDDLLQNSFKELKSALCCNLGACLRIRGHAGRHDGACEHSADTVLTGASCDKLTPFGAAELKKLVDKCLENV